MGADSSRCFHSLRGSMEIRFGTISSSDRCVMRRSVFFLAWLLVLATMAGCSTSHTEPPPPPPPFTEDMQAVADGSNRFAIDLYGKLRDTEKGNLFFSPYSVHTALAMTATGAKGNTRDEMVKVLHLPADEQKMLASGDLAGFF